MPAVHIATPDGQKAVHEEEDAKRLLLEGNIPSGSLFWKPGMSEWRPITEFEQSLHHPPPPPLSPTVAPGSFPNRPYRGATTHVPKTSGLAVTSLILGLLAFFFSILTAIPGIVCGHIALSQIRQANGELGGRGLAITGLIFSYLFLAMFLFFLVFVLAGVGT